MKILCLTILISITSIAAAQTHRLEKLWETDAVVEKKNSADIGYDQRRKILFVPTFNGRTVAAYRLL